MTLADQVFAVLAGGPLPCETLARQVRRRTTDVRDVLRADGGELLDRRADDTPVAGREGQRAVEDAIHRDASVRPKQRNQTRIRRLDATEMSTLVAAGSSERWRVAIALAGYAGLRLGELRGLRWSDIDLEENQLTVSRALLPKGEAKPPKTEAGKREVPLFPELRRALVAWKLRSPGPARATTCSARRPAPPSKSAA